MAFRFTLILVYVCRISCREGQTQLAVIIRIGYSGLLRCSSFPCFTVRLQAGLRLEEVLLYELGTVHFPRTFHKIMSLIDQQAVFFLPVIEETLKMHGRIEQIIIVADHGIRPQRYVKTHLKRAYHMLFGIFYYHVAVDILFMCEHIINAVVDTVKMAFGPFTGIRITVRLFEYAQFFL